MLESPKYTQRLEELKQLLNDPRTGLKPSSNTNKTYMAILAIFDDMEEDYKELNVLYEDLQYNDIDNQ